MSVVLLVKAEPKRKDGSSNPILKHFWKQTLSKKLLQAAVDSGHIVVCKQ